MDTGRNCLLNILIVMHHDATRCIYMIIHMQQPYQKSEVYTSAFSEASKHLDSTPTHFYSELQIARLRL